MINFMNKFRINKAIFFVLITAMLSMQWSTAHIHLAEHHEHDGSHHQHTTKAHTHQTFTHSDDFIGSSQKVYLQETNVVELYDDCNIKNHNNVNEQPIVLSSVDNQLNITPYVSSIEPLEISNSKRRYIDDSTINLRAPPKHS